MYVETRTVEEEKEATIVKFMDFGKEVERISLNLEY